MSSPESALDMGVAPYLWLTKGKGGHNIMQDIYISYT